ncbi:MAG: polysaccharide deacetylase family protein [Gemmatimonadota bacterium]|nr:MAG: polysaccharide deacetylase family protein [Gemmatimonadota bacterium]
MPRQAYEPPRARTPAAWGGAILLLGLLTAGLIGAAVLLWQSIDIEAVLEAATDEPPAVEAVVAEVVLPRLPTVAPWSVYLYESRHSADFFPDSEYYPALLERWGELLGEVGAGVSRVGDAGSVDGLPSGVLLVIPAAVCLDSDERAAVKRFRGRGGHLLVSWAIGARDADCNWLGYGYVGELTGAESAGPMEAGPPTYLVAPHGGAATAGLPPGSRIELKNEPWIGVRADESVVFWSDWALNAKMAPGGGAAGAVLTSTGDSGGRLAWFGYRLDMGASERDQRLVDRLAHNVALWAGGHVVADVDPWPRGYRAALTVTQDVEHSFRNSQRLAQRLSQLDVPVTFFVVTQLAMQYPELARSLQAAGEVGSHGVDHRQIAGRRWGTQLMAMWTARSALEDWLGGAPPGFRPPRELFDRSTLEGWRRLGGRYIAASNGARSAAPELFRMRAGEIVVLPRVVDDDYTVMVVRGRRAPDVLRAEFEAAVEKIRSLGGLDLLTTHTQLMDSDGRIAAVESAVNVARAAGDVWIARASEVAEWWLQRSDLEVEVRGRLDHSAAVSVRNRGEESISGAWLHFYLPEERSTYAAPEIGEETLEA